MKKIINLLSFLIIINLLFLGNLLIKKYTHCDLLPISHAKSFIHSNDNYNLIVKILKDANKNNLLQYADYIELKSLSSIPNDTQNRIAFTLSLPEQVSFIAFYKILPSGQYEFECIVDNLSSIDEFYFYKNFLVIQQASSNNSDTFDKRNFFEVFINKNDQYVSVFSKNIYSEKIFKDSNDTFKEVQNSTIDCLEGDLPRILCITTTIVYKGINSPLSDDLEFNEIKKNTSKEIYQWNNSKEIFSTLNKEDINVQPNQ